MNADQRQLFEEMLAADQADREAQLAAANAAVSHLLSSFIKKKKVKITFLTVKLGRKLCWLITEISANSVMTALKQYQLKLMFVSLRLLAFS